MDQIRRRDKHTNWYRRIALFGVLLVVGMVSLSFSSVRSVLSRSVYMVAPSVWEWGEGVHNKWNSFLTLWSEKNTLIAENLELRESASRMAALALDRDSLEQKVVFLEGALSRDTDNSRIVANVIFNPRKALYDTLVIDRGERDGVSVGDQVVYSGVGAIGKITEVYESSAKVVLYSSPGEKHDVVIQRENLVWGTAVGRGMGNFEAKIPQGSTVVSGDNVFLPKSSGVQHEVILGVVGYVEENPSEPFTRVLFRTSFNISNVQIVEVISSLNKK